MADKSENKLLPITVKTIKNGYTLTVKYEDGKEKNFMYFTPQKLIAGLICHVEDRCRDFVDIEEYFANREGNKKSK